MRRPSLVGATTAVVACLLIPSVAGARPQAHDSAARTAALKRSSPAPVRLQTDGGYFRDARGRVVLLHGVNIVDKGPAKSAYPNTDEAGNGFTAKDARFLQSSGFNFVRLGLNWSQLLPHRPTTPGHLRVSRYYLNKVVRVARLLAAHRIYYMLDLHQDCFWEWPAWAIPRTVGAGQLPTVSAFPECQLTPNGVTQAFDNLFRMSTDKTSIPVDEVWADYRAVWEQVAERFRHLDYLMGYDPINEPGGTHTLECDLPPVGCPQMDEKIQAFEENAMSGIRAADPVGSRRHALSRAGIVMFEPEVLEGTSGAPTGLGDTPIKDPKVGLTFHVYCGTDQVAGALPASPPKECHTLLSGAFDGTGGVGGSRRNAMHMTGADVTAAGGRRVPDSQPAPQLMGEFGATNDPAVIADTLDLADADFVSWAYWGYRQYGNPDGVFDNRAEERCVCFDPGGKPEPSPRADVLIRPYAQATAGMPLSYSYDTSTGRMVYRYEPGTSGSKITRLYVPRHYAPLGYRASAQSAEITSGKNSPTLLVRATSDKPVTVEVTRRSR